MMAWFPRQSLVEVTLHCYRGGIRLSYMLQGMGKRSPRRHISRKSLFTESGLPPRIQAAWLPPPLAHYRWGFPLSHGAKACVGGRAHERLVRFGESDNICAQRIGRAAVKMRTVTSRMTSK